MGVGVGIGFNEAKTNCGIARISGILTVGHGSLSLRTADVFPVVASLPPKINFRRERSDDGKYVCRSQATDH